MTRQFFSFLLVGGIQYLLDAAAFSLLILLFATEASNILSRMIGAFAGYFMNGYFTFNQPSKAAVSLAGLFRFVLVWCVMTAISTLAIRELISLIHEEEWIYVVGIKLVVEMVLVVLSFTLQRVFVFR
jgi:putative flippase GtrA